MILLPPTEIDWDSTNRKMLEEFLQTPTGQRLISVLAHYSPAFGDGSDPNKTLVASGRVEGYADAVGWLVRLTKEHPTEKAPSKTEYPDLDDDKAWEAVDRTLGGGPS